MNRSVVIAVVVVLLLAVAFSACSYVVGHQRDRIIRSAEAGSLPARVLVDSANFWARYAIFLTIAGVVGVFQIRRLISRFH